MDAAVTGYAFKGRSVTLEVRLGKDWLGAKATDRCAVPTDLSGCRVVVDLSLEVSSTPSRNGRTAINADLPPRP